jgi:hypothetical protein
MALRDWTAHTQEDGVSDAFVFFRDLPLDRWDAWLDARDLGLEQPRWSDLDGWEQHSIFSVDIMQRLVRNANDLRSLRIAWRFCSPERGSTSDSRLRLVQERAIAMAGEDGDDPLRDRSFFEPD